MNGRVLLDTNIVIAFFAQESVVLQNMQSVEKFFIPSVVLGELYFGARKSGRSNQNLKRIDELAMKTSILNCDEWTAQEYGQIKDELRRKGRPIPANDIWIAAVARQHDLMLITRDGHFKQVENLPMSMW